MARRLLLLALLLVPPLAAAAPAGAREVMLVEDEEVEEALAQAGKNRPELEKALAHFAQERGQKWDAMRFLVANMPGKGYVVTALEDEKGNEIPYDPLSYPDFAAAQKALDEIEKKHGKVDFDRSRLVLDLETLTAEYLIRHVDHAFEAWESTPPARRVSILTFLGYVLPYRGSEEPAEDWLGPMLERRPKLPAEEDADARTVWRRVNEAVGRSVRFDERYYLHPTDQGFAEMEKSRMGRCEDITNLTTYHARAMGLATATDYTPAWGHRDNNHAWNVLLDADGFGSDPGNAHAAKVYRKTFDLRRTNLAFLLPKGREAPNRFLASKCYVDVTREYAAAGTVTVPLDPAVVKSERFAYICVFNGGEWVAIDWGPIENHHVVRFGSMGRGIAYLPAVHDGKRLIPVAPPRILHKDGLTETLAGTGSPTSLVATAVSPEQVSPDKKVVTPLSHLTADTTYLLQRWDGEWKTVKEFVAGAEAPSFDGLPKDGLYWLVAKDSRRLERIFTIEEGRQRFW